jgi:hypothetical protein
MDGDLEEDVLIIDMHSELISPPSGEHTVTRCRYQLLCLMTFQLSFGGFADRVIESVLRAEAPATPAQHRVCTCACHSQKRA